MLVKGAQEYRKLSAPNRIVWSAIYASIPPDIVKPRAWKRFLRCWTFNTLRPRQIGRHFADDNLKCIFLKENVWIPIKIPLKFVPKGQTNNIPALVQIMAWRRPGDKPLYEPMVVCLLTHICVTRPQWVKRGVQWCGALIFFFFFFLGGGGFGQALNPFPLGKMAAVLQTLFSDAFSWMKIFVFWLKFHWSLFLRVRLTITQHWFR